MCEEVRVCVSERDIIGVVGCFKSEISSHVSGLAKDFSRYINVPLTLGEGLLTRVFRRVKSDACIASRAPCLSG